MFFLPTPHIFAPLFTSRTGLVTVLTSSNKVASELKKGVELGKLKFFQPQTTPLLPKYFEIKYT